MSRTTRRTVLQVGALGVAELALHGPLVTAVARAAEPEGPPCDGYRGLDLTTGKQLTVEPEDAAFVEVGGAYTSPQLGDLRLERYGTLVTGTYHSLWSGRPVYGQLSGEVRGTLVRFDWAERRGQDGAVVARGHGHLVWRDAEGTSASPRLFGARSARILWAPHGQGRSFPKTLPAEPWYATRVQAPVAPVAG